MVARYHQIPDLVLSKKRALQGLDNKMASHYEIIGEEWVERARELAEWAMLRLVNRKDIWGQYASLTPGEQKKLGRTYKAMTLPVASKRGPDMVTLDKLTRHFASLHRRRPQLIGMQAKSKEDTSLWMGIDIDMHDGDKADSEEHARRNLVAALKWWRDLQAMGYDPLLFDSNGNGGFHLWVLFDEPAPTEKVFAFAWSIVSTWEENNLSEEPETFPKQLKPGSLGAWFRLPGLHHTRDHHARVWSGDDWLDDPWLSGHAAIDAMLQCVPGPPPPELDAPSRHSRKTIRSTEKPKAAPVKRAADRKRKFKRTTRPTVCIDLDGVLAVADARGGIAEIGEPHDGAVEFSRQVAEFAEVVILTSRLAHEPGSGKTAIQRKAAARIEDWLDEHGFAYSSVYTGVGKPPASAYVDDRAVACKPASGGVAAFADAVEIVGQLCE